MSDKKEFVIRKQGMLITVSKEVYLYYYRSNRRIKYFEYDIKTETAIRDKDGSIIGYAPSKEESYDLITEDGTEFADRNESVEDDVIHRLLLDKLHRCLLQLDEDEKRLINELFFNGKSLNSLADEFGAARMTLQDKKVRVLKKLKKMMEI